MADYASNMNFVGIDLGGTNIKVGVVNDAGETLAYLSTPTLVEKGPEDATKRMAETVHEAIRKAVDQPVSGDFGELRGVIDDASTILYLTDNAGEIVYDRLFVELLTSEDYGKKVTVAVRGKPILNDALLEDAEEAGITEVAPTIGNGGDGLGTIFSLTSPEFNELFASADLVLAKGLANYETLGVGPREITPKKIAFLFKAKCPFIAARCGAKLGDLVVRLQ